MSKGSTIHLDHNALARSLLAADFQAEVGGEAAARFVFAKAGERAVEISVSDAGIRVEYWDGDDGPAFDRTFSDVDAAAMDVNAWLGGKAG